MNAQAVSCPKCRLPLPEGMFNTGVPVPCPNCRSELLCEVFPALSAGPRIGRPGDPLVDASEASCFFHPEKRAAIACESCGRFLCALCDLEVESSHICPSCLSAGRKKGKLAGLDQYRSSYTGIALLLATVPVVAFWPLTTVTAPAALVFLVLAWRKPPSLTGRRRWIAATLTVLFAVGEIVAWIVFGGKLLTELL